MASVRSRRLDPSPSPLAAEIRFPQFKRARADPPTRAFGPSVQGGIDSGGEERSSSKFPLAFLQKAAL